MQDLIAKLSVQFRISGEIYKTSQQTFVFAEKEQLISLLTNLRDVHGYTHLVMVTCVDWLENDQLQLTYILHNYTLHTDLGIKVLIPRKTPVMDSIHHLWKQARVYEQELNEMFGVSFPGSPGQGIPMILEGWQGPPPMLRDFDTKKYSEENYSNRERHSLEPEEHMKKHLYPED